MDEQVLKIKRFWDDRAIQYGESYRATLQEEYLRRLEIKTMIKYIERYNPKTVLDVGCGNGFSTKTFARRFPQIQFTGIDYSEEMISKANNEVINNSSFFVGDVLELNTLPQRKFDFILTQRCIQNLPDYNKQKKGINNLLNLTTPEGVVALMECSKDGVKKLNSLRSKLNLKPITNIEPWHNNFLSDNDMIIDFGAKVIHFSSTYMTITRLLPGVLQRISKYSYILPSVGKGGYDKLYLIEGRHD